MLSGLMCVGVGWMLYSHFSVFCLIGAFYVAMLLMLILLYFLLCFNSILFLFTMFGCILLGHKPNSSLYRAFLCMYNCWGDGYAV